VAAHGFLQKLLHTFQARNLEIQFVKLLSSQPSPSRRGWGAFVEAMEEELNLSDCEPCLSREFDDGQVKLQIGAETSLSALPRNPREKPNPFVETNRRGRDSRLSCNFADLHASPEKIRLT